MKEVRLKIIRDMGGQLPAGATRDLPSRLCTALATCARLRMKKNMLRTI
jgi:hypothetical protein